MDDRPEEMRLDALAAAAGVATTTIRLYQQRGLLPGPRVVGRTGWYSQHHLARLQLIGRLQEQGFSLAGIGRLLDAAERGGDLTDLVGVEAELEAVLRLAEPVVVEPAELLDRFGSEALTPQAMARATELGLIESTDDGRLRIPDRRFVDIGAELVHLGVGVDVVLDEWARLRAQTDQIAERFIAVFETEILGADWRDRIDARLSARAADSLPRLMRLATHIVVAALDNSIADRIDLQLRELVAAAGGPPLPPRPDSGA